MTSCWHRGWSNYGRDVSLACRRMIAGAFRHACTKAMRGRRPWPGLAVPVRLPPFGLSPAASRTAPSNALHARAQAAQTWQDQPRAAAAGGITHSSQISSCLPSWGPSFAVRTQCECGWLRQTGGGAMGASGAKHAGTKVGRRRRTRPERPVDATRVGDGPSKRVRYEVVIWQHQSGGLAQRHDITGRREEASWSIAPGLIRVSHTEGPLVSALRTRATVGVIQGVNGSVGCSYSILKRNARRGARRDVAKKTTTITAPVTNNNNKKQASKRQQPVWAEAQPASPSSTLFSLPFVSCTRNFPRLSHAGRGGRGALPGATTAELSGATYDVKGRKGKAGGRQVGRWALTKDAESWAC